VRRAASVSALTGGAPGAAARASANAWNALASIRESDDVLARP